MLNFEK